MSSVSNIIRTTAHTALSSRSATSSASEELQNLFGKLHMDAIASVGTASPTGTGATSATAASSTASTSSSSSSDTTGLISGLRHLFDGALNTAKDARATAKAVTAYTHGAGLAGLAATAVSKLA